MMRIFCLDMCLDTSSICACVGGALGLYCLCVCLCILGFVMLWQMYVLAYFFFNLWHTAAMFSVLFFLHVYNMHASIYFNICVRVRYHVIIYVDVPIVWPAYWCKSWLRYAFSVVDSVCSEPLQISSWVSNKSPPHWTLKGVRLA